MRFVPGPRALLTTLSATCAVSHFVVPYRYRKLLLYNAIKLGGLLVVLPLWNRTPGWVLDLVWGKEDPTVYVSRTNG
jgi:hypothetical protein